MILYLPMDAFIGATSYMVLLIFKGMILMSYRTVIMLVSAMTLVSSLLMISIVLGFVLMSFIPELDISTI